jgi:hypothetical protein
MSVSLELDRGRQRAWRQLGLRPRPGQQGSRSRLGIAVDAVVADFIAGAAERLVVEGRQGGDLLWVEGQGSLIHPTIRA